MYQQDAMVNEKIVSNKIILINAEGKRLGEYNKNLAINLAKENKMDLVQVSDGQIPICKIMDYGKKSYEENKKNKKNKKSQIKTKETRFRETIGPHDKETKIRQIDKFLKQGHYVKISVSCSRGLDDKKSTSHADHFLNTILNNIGHNYELEKDPKLSGNFYSLIIKPIN